MTLTVPAVIALILWVFWRLYRSKFREPEIAVAVEGRLLHEEIRSAAEEEGHDYVLDPFDGDYGNGYTLRRVEDWERLSWKRADAEPGLLPFNVVGESHRTDQIQDDGFAPGSRFSLVPEPDNPHDPNAVAVWNGDRTAQAGYVPAELAERMGEILEDDPEHICLSMWETRREGERTGVRCLLLYDDVSVGTVEAP